MANAKFDVDVGSGYVDADNGVDAASGATVTCRINDMSGIRPSEIAWRVIGTSDSSFAKPTLTLGGSPTGQTATFTFPAGTGKSLGIECVVNQGPDYRDNPATTKYTAGIYVQFANTQRPFFVGETFEADATHGPVERMNAALNGLAGGSGYTTIQEEGVGVTQRAVANFIGSYVTAADNSGAGRTDITFRSILNADVDASAAIAFSKLASDVTWANVLTNGATSGGTSPLLTSGDAYDTDSAVDLTLARAGATVAVANGSQWNFQNDNIVTTGYYQTGATPASAGSFFRIANAQEGFSRNAGNTANVRVFIVTATDVLQLGDATNAVSIFYDASTSHVFRASGTEMFRGTSSWLRLQVGLDWSSGFAGDRVINTGADEDLVVQRNGTEHTRFGSGYIDAHTNYAQFDGISTPSTPTSTEIRTYCKASGTSAFAYVDDAGMEHIL